MFIRDCKIEQKIIPTLLFVGAVCSKAEEAMNFYASVFHSASVNFILRYEKGEEPEKEGTIKHVGFILRGQQFAAMDRAQKHNFTFNEAISFIVHCETQEAIDYFWEKLSADPSSEQYGFFI